MHVPGCLSPVNFCEVSAVLGDHYKLIKPLSLTLFQLYSTLLKEMLCILLFTIMK